MVLAAWACLGALAVLLLCFGWQNPDIFYHLFLGKQVIATHQAQPPDALLAHQPGYVNVYWLFQVLVYGAERIGGVRGVSVLFLLAWFGVFLFWARTIGLARSPAFGLPFALGALLVFQNRFDTRPEVFSYLLLSAQVYWLFTWDLDRPLPWRRYALFAASEALWANMHGYFVLGPVLVGSVFASELIAAASGHRSDPRPGTGQSGFRSPRIANLARLLALTLIASIVSPFGFGTWTFAHTLWVFLRTMRGAIIEFGPPTGEALRVWTVVLFWVYWGLTLLACGWLLVRRNWRLAYTVPAALGLYLSATGMRNIPLVLLLGAPVWRGIFEGPANQKAGKRAASRPSPRSARDPGTAAAPHAPHPPGAAGRVPVRMVAATVAACSLALSIWIVQGGFARSTAGRSAFGLALRPYLYPVRFAEYLRRVPFNGKVFNNASDGGYLEYYFPGLHPYMDSRYVDPATVRGYFGALRDPAAFRRLDGSVHFDAALLSVTESPRVASALFADPAWKAAWADLHRVFFVRPDAAGSSASRPELGFYRGEDLSTPVEGMRAIQWVMILGQSRQRDLLLDALRQLGAAPKIPAPVIQLALQIGIATKDREIVAAGRAMVPRMAALAEDERQAVQQLLRQSEIVGL